MQAARERRQRRQQRPAGKPAVQDAVEGAAAANAAAIDHKAAPSADDATLDKGFDPSEHTVAEVTAYLADNPDAVKAVVAAEKSGKGRASILALGDS